MNTQSDSFSLIVGNRNPSAHPYTEGIVRDLLAHIGAIGDYRLAINQKIVGSGPHKGVEIRPSTLSGIPLDVQPDGNDSRCRCVLSRLGGFNQDLVYKDLVAALKGTAFRPDSLNEPAEEASTAGSPAPAPSPEPVVPASVAPESEEEGASQDMRGFLKDITAISLVLDLLRSEYGEQEFTNVQVSELMRKEGACPKDTNQHALGQVVANLEKKGYIERRSSQGRIRFYRLGAKGIELLAGQPIVAKLAPQSVPVAMPTFDLAKAEAGLEKLRTELSKITDEQKELKSVEEGIAACDAETNDLNAKIQAVAAQKQKFESRKAELKLVVDNPEMVAIRAKLAKASEAIAILKGLSLE